MRTPAPSSAPGSADAGAALLGDVTLTMASGVALHFDLAHAADEDMRRAVDHNEFRLSPAWRDAPGSNAARAAASVR